MLPINIYQSITRLEKKFTDQEFKIKNPKLIFLLCIAGFIL